MVNETKSKDFRKKPTTHKSESAGSPSIASKSKSNFPEIGTPAHDSASQDLISAEEHGDEIILESNNDKIRESEIETLGDGEEGIEYKVEVEEEISKEMLEDLGEEIDVLDEDEAVDEQVLEVLSKEMYEDEDELEEEESFLQTKQSSFFKRKHKKDMLDIEEDDEEEDEDEMLKELEDFEEDEIGEEKEESMELVEAVEEEGEEGEASSEEEDEDLSEEEESESEEEEEDDGEEFEELEDAETKSSIYFVSESKASMEEEEMTEEKEVEIEEEQQELLEDERVSSYEIDEDEWLNGLEPMDLLEEMEEIDLELDVSEKSQAEFYKSFLSTAEEFDVEELLSISVMDEELIESAKEIEEEEEEEEEKEVKVQPRYMTPERALLEDEYKDAFYECNVAREQNLRLQDQLVQMLTKNEKDYSEYNNEGETLQEKELYVKLFGRYVTLMKHYSEMEDLGKEELFKHIKLKKEVEELFDSYIERKWNNLVGKNRNEKSSKVQLATKLEEAERKRWAEANDLQLANLAIKMQMEKLSQLLQQREVIGGNFTIMGYNQLKHDNLMAREIIAQKNEQCEAVLRNTKTSAQKMSHVKEKLNYVRQQYKTKVDTLYSKEKLCDQIYSELKEAKRARTKARQLLSSLQSKNDLLSYPELLMDYESGVEKTLRLRQQMGRLSNEYNTTAEHFKVITKKLQGLDQ